MDEIHLHKMRSFREMVTGFCPEGGVVGVPVPIGYEDVSDLEG